MFMMLNDKKPLIQIVEDSLTQAKRLERLLKDNGYDVSVARNGVAGLEGARQMKPTVVITDVMMPDMDGYEMCRRMKDDPCLQDIPVVILTSLSDPCDVIRGLQCGADNFITKPYEDGYLLSRLIHILANMELRKSGQAQMSVEVYFGGQYHKLTADRIQIVDLLLSTFEAAVMQNSQLQKLSGDYRNALDDVKRVQANFQTLMETTGDGVVVVGWDGTVRYMNPAAELLFEMSSSEMIGRVFPFPVDEGAREISFQASTGTVHADMRVVSSNWDGEVVRLATVRDISETVFLRRRLEIQAVTDSLTCLYNRRGFMDMGEKALNAADSALCSVTCVFADLDNFKTVNDTFGHGEGDLVLQATADSLKATFTDSDIIGRVGGDEFAVISVRSDEDGEDDVRLRIEKAMSSIRDRYGRFSVSMSIGMCTRRPGEEMTLSELMIEADRKMYSQKQQRRD